MVFTFKLNKLDLFYKEIRMWSTFLFYYETWGQLWSTFQEIYTLKCSILWYSKETSLKKSVTNDKIRCLLYDTKKKTSKPQVESSDCLACSYTISKWLLTRWTLKRKYCFFLLTSVVVFIPNFSKLFIWIHFVNIWGYLWNKKYTLNHWLTLELCNSGSQCPLHEIIFKQK